MDDHACVFVPRRFPPELILCLEGEVIDRVWFVKSGAVALRRAGADTSGPGAVQTIRYAGTLVGFEALVTGASSYTCETALESVLCAAPLETLGELLDPTPSLARTFLDAAIRSAISDDRVPSAHGTALSHVAAWLYAHRDAPDSLALPRHIIADLVAVCPETLARSLTELDRRGVIAKTRTSLAVTAPDALAVIAAH
jgi:CRP-like cAMP-binding protein